MMKKFLKMSALFLLTLMVFVCIDKGGVEAKASVTQADAQKTSVTVTWTEERDAVSYNVYLKEYGQEDFALVGNTPELSYTLTGLKPATKYVVKAAPVKADGTEGYGSTNYDVVTIPDKMTGFKQERWWYFNKEVNVKWDKQTGASGYEIKFYDNKGKLKKTSKEGRYSTSTTFPVKNNVVYKARARSFTTFNGKNYYSSWATIYCLNQPMISKVKVSGNKLEVKWKKTNGATQYKVYVSTKMKTGYKKVATVSKSKGSCTVKKFNKKKISPKKTYYVYVEAICNKGGTKNTSGSLYCWNTKRGGGDYSWSHRL